MPRVDDLSRLAQRARAGDDGALDSFVSLAYEQVWRLCANLVDEQSAADLAQETFIRVVRALDQFRHDASARTWLLGIARRVCMDELRARYRRRRRDSALTRDSEPWVGAGEEVVVADLLRRLDPERRAAFVLTQLIGLSYEEAAQVCECPSGTIRSRVARARLDLLELVRDPHPSHSNARWSRWNSG